MKDFNQLSREEDDLKKELVNNIEKYISLSLEIFANSSYSKEHKEKVNNLRMKLLNVEFELYK